MCSFSTVTQYAGCINMVNLYERNILFSIVFGIRGYDNDDQFKINESCKNGIIFAMHALRTIKDIAGIQSAFVGISTGITSLKQVYFSKQVFFYRFI